MTPRVTLIDLQDPALVQALGTHRLQLRTATLDTLDRVTADGTPDPDALVVDTRHRTGLPREVARLRRRYPDAGIVVLARTTDPTALLDAMRLGVNEWLAEPVAPADVAAALQRVARRPSPGSAARTIAVIGARGGVGATTLAINVAAALTQQSGAPALLVDLHTPHGDAAEFVGVEPRYSALDALEQLHRLDDRFLRGLVTRAACGVDVLGSTARVPAVPVTADQVRTFLALAGTVYRYVVLDVPRTDAALLDATDAASQVVVVTGQDVSALRRATQLAARLRRPGSTARLRIAIGRLDPQAEVSVADVAEAVGLPVAFSLPGDTRTAVSALNRGTPIVGQGASRLASALRACAADLGALESPPPATTWTGVLGRLTGR